MNPLWSYILTAGGVLGIYLAGRKSLWGWVIGFAMQLLWVAYAIFTSQWGFIVSAFAYGTVYLTNYLRWKKQEQEKI